MGRADFRQFIFGEWPVEIRIQVVGLPTSPVDTQRGIHIHEYGDTGGNCARVGPHFNPTLTRHGGRNNYPFLRHVGDLGNMLQSPKGVASTQFRDNIISLQGQNSIIGRSLVIKYERDDEGTGTNSRSQVDGNARTPVACCTIGRAGPRNWQDPYTEEELVAMSGGVWNNGGGSNFGGNTPVQGANKMDGAMKNTNFNAAGNTINDGSQNMGSLNGDTFNLGGSPVGGGPIGGNMGGNIQPSGLNGETKPIPTGGIFFLN
ncbi:hypothetical protein KUTeg_016442 [Tegillarca granosa]|uniref:Superoxide dismutase copper/zinc binding domain-containing protein n=1 Tax=Tegillarca granosa TaxID=220873 RepID=A0ABQ9EPN0_TEGGR|nr:hypothetical protein KUTeg_016442 [Tegillarca granosa]